MIDKLTLLVLGQVRGLRMQTSVMCSRPSIMVQGRCYLCKALVAERAFERFLTRMMPLVHCFYGLVSFIILSLSECNLLTQRSSGGKGLPATGMITAERSLSGVRSLVLFLASEGSEVLDAEVALEWFVCAVMSIAEHIDLYSWLCRRESDLHPVCVTRCRSSLPF